MLDGEAALVGYVASIVADMELNEDSLAVSANSTIVDEAANAVIVDEAATVATLATVVDLDLEAVALNGGFIKEIV